MNKPVNHIHTVEQDELLDALQRDGFKYFIDKVNPDNSLIADSTWEDNTCSIAAVGFALACYPVGVEHGWISRRDAIERTLVTLRHFQTDPPGSAFLKTLRSAGTAWSADRGFIGNNASSTRCGRFR